MNNFPHQFKYKQFFFDEMCLFVWEVPESEDQYRLFSQFVIIFYIQFMETEFKGNQV